MILVQIPEKEEPKCLKELRDIKGSTYHLDLKDDCKDEVENKLIESQKSLCAYCQKSILRVKTIEHYVPISKDETKQLVWNNLIAVCSGNWYLDPHNDKKIPYCHKNRDNSDLALNPKNKEHIDSLYYDKEHRIRSSNSVLDDELNDILNLNFSEILTARMNAFINVDKIYKKIALQRKLSLSATLTKAIESVKKLNPEYSGFILHRYEAKLNKNR